MVLEQNSQMNLAHDFQDTDYGRTERSSRRSLWPTQGSRKGLLAAIGVGLVLVVLVISAAVYVNNAPASDDSVETKQRLVAGSSLKDAQTNTITLPDILSGLYGAKGYNGTWISGSKMQYFDTAQNLILHDAANVEQPNVLKINNIDLQNALIANGGSRRFEVTLSPSERYALVGYDSEKLYRHSYFAKFGIYDVETKTMEQLVAPPELRLPHNPDLLQMVQWAPKTDAIAFVYENNVFYRPSAAPTTPSTQLTTTGRTERPYIYNGVADWVYEEEMFGTYRALWFSPEGTKLAFATFNDTEVRDIEFSIYGNPGQYPQNQYPRIESIPYPKAGSVNPTANIYISNLANLATPPTLKIKTIGVGDDAYIGTTTWVTDEELLVVTLNRHQNHSKTLVCPSSATELDCRLLLVKNQANGWIDINTPVVIKSGAEFLYVGSTVVGAENYRHIIRVVTATTPVTETAVTTGKFSVDSIVGVDEAKDRIYFMAPFYNGTTTDPSESHLYYIGTNAAPTQTTCVTCNLHNLEMTSICRSNGASLSKDFQYFVQSCNGPAVPEVVIRSLQNEPYPVTTVWVDNNDLKAKLQLVPMPIVQDYDIPVKNNFTAKARLWLPPNYNKNEKYPMLVDVYGGPGSQKLTQRFVIDWGVSLVTSKNVIYASIDGRGSGRQSEDLMFQIYRNLGTVEIEDQIAAAKWLVENNKDNVIDAKRTAIWGWSYGGYSTAMVMGTDLENIYKCGISVAPVTSWTFYDTIYTERYMGLPTREDNLVGYNFSDVTNHVSNFKTKKYYLIHGNADDNVHYQQSMLLSRAFETADILFRQQSYPDEDHGIGSVRRHLYHSLENFLFEECF